MNRRPERPLRPLVLPHVLPHVLLLALTLAACGADAPDSAKDAGAGADAAPVGTQLHVTVPAVGAVHVRFDPPGVVADDGPWDARFSGWDVHTNGGASGPGVGGAFGPLDALACAADAPTLPIVIRDHAGGAFEDWYAYDGTSHALHSRFHVYGVRDEAHAYKVQILSYYGEVAGAPTAAVYRVRWAEVPGGPTKELAAIDATAGGPSATGPSACLDLGSGAVVFHTAAEAATTSDWHLCFRRDAISVNGERGGPRGVRAVDTDGDQRGSETLALVAARTAASEEARFTAARLDDPTLVFRGDRVVSAFTDAWFTRTDPRAPLAACWVVVGHDGSHRYGLLFDRFDGATATSPGAITLHVRQF